MNVNEQGEAATYQEKENERQLLAMDVGRVNGELIGTANAKHLSAKAGLIEAFAVVVRVAALIAVAWTVFEMVKLA